MTTSSWQASVGRAAALVAALAAVASCASLRHGARSDAVAAALQNVCGSSRAPADSSCTVRAVTRDANGYRVVIDRRPPAGNDRVAVHVGPGGLFGGSRIDVTPLDTTSAPPVR
jgi:hypothetical protein